MILQIEKLNNFKMPQFLVGICLIVTLFNSSPAYAQKKAVAEEYMTKGDAVVLISATDFMKRKIGELLSWTIGYDITKVSRVRLTPTINYVKAVPKKVPPDGRTILEVLASVDDPGGMLNIAGVRADLSAIGRLPNTMLVDNGLFGDKKAGDGVYTLQTSVSTKVGLGPKDIPVAVANKKGWLALAKTTLEIKKNPAIIEARVVPEKILAGSQASVTIRVKVDNPGRIEDVKGVVADLRALGLSERTYLQNEAKQGEVMAADSWSIQFDLQAGVSPGEYLIPIEVTNLIGGKGMGSAAITVYE